MFQVYNSNEVYKFLIEIEISRYNIMESDPFVIE